MIKKNELKNHITPELLEGQEHLSLQHLNMLIPKTDKYPLNKNVIRPDANFINLMDWTLSQFSPALKDTTNLNKFVHNRIIIDGQLLNFCEGKGISVECLYKDSLISWKTDHNYEKFFAQGVFLLKAKGLEFLHCALWHKGNANEDEISFFVIVSDKNYEAYISLRNEFDAWVQERDRSNLHIRVIDGEDLPYTKDNSWKELFLPESIKKDVKDLVENFLSSKDFYLEKKIPWKRGVLLYGQPGCHAKGTDILMFDGSLKKVEDIVIGDLLMGPDSESREVLELVRGNEKMYEITPNKGKSFCVNNRHELYLERSSNDSISYPEKMDISVLDYLKLNDYVRSRYHLVKCDTLSFDCKDSGHIMDPYVLGLWIGDGTAGKSEITSADGAIIDHCKTYAVKNNLCCKISCYKHSKAKRINFSHIKGDVNHFSLALRKFGIFKKKEIPQEYLTSSVNDRLALLAGIIDTDGHYHKAFKDSLDSGSFEILQKSEKLSNQITFLAGSLGFNYSIKKVKKSIKSINFVGEYYRINIMGPIWKIPCILKRKQPLFLIKNKNHRRVHIKKIVDIGDMPYYGVTVNKDHKYIMDDFWITNNCGKSSIIKTIISEYNFKPVTIIPGANSESMRGAFSYAEQQSPSLLYFEDLDSLIEGGMDVSSFLNLLDGISSKNGLLVIATANDVKKLKANITQRPSRFDRKFEVPLPNADMAFTYLKRWFGDILDTKKCREIAKSSEKYELSYAFLKELYISSMFEALSHNRKSPTMKDVDITFLRIVKEKNMINSGGSINTDVYFK